MQNETNVGGEESAQGDQNPRRETDSAEEPSLEFDEVFSGRGFFVGRRGRLIVMETNRSSDEQRIMLQRLASRAEELQDSIGEQVADLEAILLQFNPLDVIAHTFMMNAVWDLETYKEYAHEGNDAFTEYVGLLCLTRPFEAFADRPAEPISGVVLKDIQDRVKRLFSDTMFHLRVKGIDPEADTAWDNLAELRFRALSHSLFVRYPAYCTHLTDVLRGTLGPLGHELEPVLGFTVEDALAVAVSIREYMSQTLHTRFENARRLEQELLRAVSTPGGDEQLREYVPAGVLEGLQAMDKSSAEERIRAMAIGWAVHALGDTLSFKDDEIAEDAAVDDSRVRAFLDRMSLAFGEVAERYRFPSPTHPLMTKPLVRHKERYLCPVPSSLEWTIRPAIESFLNPDDDCSISSDRALWAMYSRVRAAYVEEKALEYLSQALGGPQVFRNLKYQFCENGESIEGELDGLVMLDSALFLVEAKSGTLSPPARRGAPARMLQEVKVLVEDAYLQALRAKKYIEAADSPVMRLGNGREIHIPKQQFDSIFLVTVTLEQMEAFVTMLYQLEQLGLITEGDLPWSVSLTDLRVISELIEFPSQFVHYLTRRHRLNELGKVEAHEELDWLGHYLTEGLYFDDLFEERDSPSGLGLLSYTTAIDEYYFYVTGQRQTPAPKPRQPMPQVMHEIISELESLRPQRYLHAACALLDMSGESRETFAHNAMSQRERALEDGRIHDFSLGWTEPGFGITVMFAPSEQALEMRKRLPLYCQIKKYQTRSHLWVGLGCLVDQPGWVHLTVVARHPWAQDEELDRLMENLSPLDG